MSGVRVPYGSECRYRGGRRAQDCVTAGKILTGSRGEPVGWACQGRNRRVPKGGVRLMCMHESADLHDGGAYRRMHFDPTPLWGNTYGYVINLALADRRTHYLVWVFMAHWPNFETDRAFTVLGGPLDYPGRQSRCPVGLCL